MAIEINEETFNHLIQIITDRQSTAIKEATNCCGDPYEMGKADILDVIIQDIKKLRLNSLNSKKEQM